MQAEIKMRSLASADATLQSVFGLGPFRWFDRRLQPGYIALGSCVRVQRVSSAFLYTMIPTPNAPGGLGNLNMPRFQFDVLDLDATACRNAAQALINWFTSVSFAETNDFDSPATTPPHFPNFLLNHRAGEEPQVEPQTGSARKQTGPVWVEILDYRIFNLEN